MIEEDLRNEQAIAWEVAAVDAHRTFADSFKLKPHRERFASKDLADARKRQLQGAGMIASVAPVFLKKAAMKASFWKRQVDFGFAAADGPRRLTE